MCRWIAYRGETTPLERYVTEPAHSLIAQSIQALESTASVNGDGFGLGWYGQHADPVYIARSGRPGQTKIFATCAAICNLICSLLMSGLQPALQSRA